MSRKAAGFPVGKDEGRRKGFVLTRGKIRNVG